MKEKLNISNYICPNCESHEIETKFTNYKFKYGVGEKAIDLEAEVPLLSCSNCEFEYMDFRAEEAQQDAVCHYLGVMTPREILELRKMYGYSRTEFSGITGIGEASLARWETGELIQNLANDNYLYLTSFADNLLRLQIRKRGKTGKTIEFRFKALHESRLIEKKKREAASFSL